MKTSKDICSEKSRDYYQAEYLVKMKSKNIYSFLFSFLIIPFTANLGITFLSLSTDIVLFTKEAKATNWNTFKINFDTGYRNLGKGKYQKAIDSFNKAIKNYALDGPTFYNRGNAYMGLEKYQEAIKDYLRSIELDSETGNQYAYNNIAISYENLGDYNNALKYINLAIKAFPKDGLYLENRGYYNLELGKFKQAEKDYEEAGKLYLKYKNKTRMYEDCPKIKNSIHCQMDSYYYNDLGLVKENLGNLQGALLNYNKAIEINYPSEENYIFYNNRGNIKYDLGDEKGACKDYKVAISLGDEEGKEWLDSRDGKWCKKMEL